MMMILFLLLLLIGGAYAMFGHFAQKIVTPIYSPSKLVIISKKDYVGPIRKVEARIRSPDSGMLGMI